MIPFYSKVLKYTLRMKLRMFLLKRQSVYLLIEIRQRQKFWHCMWNCLLHIFIHVCNSTAKYYFSCVMNISCFIVKLHVTKYVIFRFFMDNSQLFKG